MNNLPGCKNEIEIDDSNSCWETVIDTIMLGTDNPDYTDEFRDQMIEILSDAFEIKLRP